MSDGVERAPVLEMVVEAVPPNDAVFDVRRPENSFVEVAFASEVLPDDVRPVRPVSVPVMVELPVALSVGVVSVPFVEMVVVPVPPTASVLAEIAEVEALVKETVEGRSDDWMVFHAGAPEEDWVRNLLVAEAFTASACTALVLFP